MRPGVLAGILGALVLGGVVFAQEQITLQDILAHMAQSDEALRDVSLEYSLTHRNLYRSVSTPSQGDNPSNFRPGKLLRYEPLSPEEAARCERYEFSYRAQQAKFAFDVDVKNDFGYPPYQKKFAYNGERVMALTRWTGNPEPQGFVKLTGYPSQLVDADLRRPEDFYSQIIRRPLQSWFKEGGELKGKVELNGKQCYLIECFEKIGHDTVQVWVDPDMGFMPVRMKWTRSDGASSVYDVQKIEKIADGVYFPVKGTKEGYFIDPETGKTIQFDEVVYEAKLPTLKVNMGLKDETFGFEFPAGTQVWDATTSTKYTVGGTSFVAKEVARSLASTEDLAQGGAEVPTSHGIDSSGAGGVAADASGEAVHATGVMKLTLLLCAVGALVILAVIVVLRGRKSGRDKR